MAGILGSKSLGMNTHYKNLTEAETLLFMTPWDWPLSLFVDIVGRLKDYCQKIVILTTPELVTSMNISSYSNVVVETIDSPWFYLSDNTLNPLCDKYNFTGVVFWNEDVYLNDFFSSRGIPVICQDVLSCRLDRTHKDFTSMWMYRKPSWYLFNFGGFHTTSNLPRIYQQRKDTLQLDLPWLASLKDAAQGNIIYSKDEIFERYGLDKTKRLVFVPLQVLTHLVRQDIPGFGSTFEETKCFQQWCTRVIDSSKYEVIYKRHPKAPDDEEILEGTLTLGRDVNGFDLMNAADYVITVSCTAGFEALCLGKKVIVLGKTYYSAADIVYTKPPTSLEETAEFFSREHWSEDVDKFLTLIKEFTLTEEQHKDPQTYLRLFKCLP